MNDRVPVENCTGCSACVFSCPQKAIDMVEDGEGFLYPRVDPERCNSCGLCIKGCPVRADAVVTSMAIPTVYAGWTTDPDLLRQSTSGGVFSEIARPIIEEGGVVFGAAYDEKMTVRHMAVTSWGGLRALRGSKYVQSDVGYSYHAAEKYLMAGKRVLYSGTPCQIAGLQAAIGKDHEGLLTCDLICHGVPSPKVFRMAIDSIEKHKNSKVVDFFFRDKSFGWLYPMVRIACADGMFCDENNMDNHFNLGFLKNIYLRPACHQCTSKLGDSAADITLGDFWQLLKFEPSLINRGGTSAVIVNTARGRRAIQQSAGRLSLTECPFAYVEKESNLRKSVKPSPERAAFFADLDRLSFEELTQKYIKPRNTLVRRLAYIRRVCLRWRDNWKCA
ncbi:MAG: Coenzyme F420 hydrogenase/dehydrogenase, beta subunit C-terminal domain [Desulfobacterales bacterium]|jgi:coenzyme F420-reducing hydrogenase beta subunit|nr:Coenzyme F420 hydrogenase/dehydrogenase, beta subunit C-terminal domain [Desulfobacterales bacterium]